VQLYLSAWQSDTVNTVPSRSRSIWWASAGPYSSYATCCEDPRASRTFVPSCPASRRSCWPTACGEWSVMGLWHASSIPSARHAPRTRSPTAGVGSVSWWARWRCGAGRSWVRDRALGTPPADTRLSCSSTARAVKSASPRTRCTSLLRPCSSHDAETVGARRAGSVRGPDAHVHVELRFCHSNVSDCPQRWC
jgi:hypothetical protein